MEMGIAITPLYAGLSGLLALGLSLHASRARDRAKVSLGDGGHPQLLLASRRHGNFIEHVPLLLILMLLLEIRGEAPLHLHFFGALLFIARILHPLGLHVDRIFSAPRLVGALLTILLLAIGSLRLLFLSLPR